MKEEFKKFSKKILLEHLIKALILGISLGAIFTALIFGAFKLIGIDLFFIFYILIFLGASIIFVCLVYFNHQPDEKSIAKRLDETYHLKEKTQTMVEYPSNDNEILIKQKEDTKLSLLNCDTKELPIVIPIGYYISLVIALLIVGGSFFIPLNPNSPFREDLSSNSSLDSSSIDTSLVTSESTSMQGGEQGSDSGIESGDLTSVESGETSEIDSGDIDSASQNSDSSNSIQSGDGETQYGDGHVFTKDGFTELGDVLDDYYNQIVEGEIQGNIPDDLEDILDDYFKSLYDQSKNNEGNSEPQMAIKRRML